MSIEIGSEFWLDTNSLNSKNELPEWLLRFGSIVVTMSGRGAITLLLQQVKRRFYTVLLPEYICDSVISPFVEQGYKCFFYAINEDLSPNLESIRTYKDIDIFVHMGYYGFQTNSDLVEVIKYFKSQATIVVEDVTHTLFSQFVRLEGNDYYLGSIRKWFGLPSGGFLSSASGSINCSCLNNHIFSEVREEALLLKGEYMKTGDENLKALFLDQFAKAELFLDVDLNPYYIDNLSMRLLCTLDANELIYKRRHNYKVLFDGLKDSNSVEIVFDFFDTNVCPMFFPILIKENRDEVRKKLNLNKIYCPIHWPIPRNFSDKVSNVALEIYSNVLSLPCDQRYDRKDMERIVSVLKNI